MDDLVRRLSDGEHPVEITLRPEKTLSAFKECLDRGYVHVKFTDTRGGTELGVRLNPDETDLSDGNFASGTGRVTLVGSLTLNYVKVACTARVELETLAGSGHLTPL